MTASLSTILDRHLPDELGPILESVLGSRMARQGVGGRYRIVTSGRFRGALTADLLSFAHNHRLDTALVLIEEEVERVLYFAGGLLVASTSTVLFERLGRLLLRSGVVDRETSETLIQLEETHGETVLQEYIPEDAFSWALERRVWEVGAALYFMNQAHFLFVEGEPLVDDLPPLAIEPMRVAVEGLRLYDEWRNGAATKSDAPRLGPKGPPPSITAAMRRPPTREEEVERILRKVREFDREPQDWLPEAS